jgi:hypothetical protein
MGLATGALETLTTLEALVTGRPEG